MNWATATPTAPDAGTRAFAINTSGIVWFATQQTPIRVGDSGKPADAAEYK